ncbi:ribosome maturation factor RimM [uncultured Alistipes sp.]|uniref:ribosome maturation factor RimM n=1 Tax=uncultured Alistipes sp. TaxID=538949 RepID=UPI002804E8D0|nr:ribosome maturation factor RimM [uncultured Alistipes sp.]
MLVPAGRINKPFGTEGGLMLSLYADFPEEFSPQQTPLFVEIDSLDVPLWCERFERRGISGAVATFADFDTERRAAELVGLEFRIESGERDDDEFYLEDLIGFHVEGIETRHEDEPLHFEGRLTDYYDSEANPLFELETGGRRVLVPAVEEFIAHIDFEQRSVKLVLPEGMTDL